MATCGHCGRSGLDIATIRAHHGQGPGAEPSAQPTPPKDVTEGFWKLGDDVYKVQRAVHGSGYLYAKKLVISVSGDPGDPDTSAGWDYTPGMMPKLAAGAHELTKDEAAEFGKLYGVCCICGRTLTNEESIAAGIGPVCSGKQGW